MVGDIVLALIIFFWVLPALGAVALWIIVQFFENTWNALGISILLAIIGVAIFGK